jgi:hypothetical protein
MLINNEINLPVNTSQSAVDGPLVGVVAWDIKTKVVKKRKNGLSMHTHTQTTGTKDKWTIICRWLSGCEDEEKIKKYVDVVASKIYKRKRAKKKEHLNKFYIQIREYIKNEIDISTCLMSNRINQTYVY